MVKAGEHVREPDRPAQAGPVARLQLVAGRVAVRGANLLRPRLSLGVRLVALDDAGRVLLVRHSYLPGLHLPGGAVDAGESCRMAVEREAREEGALELPQPPEMFRIYWNHALGRRDHVVLFVARGVGSAAGAKPHFPEILEARFHAADALPEDVTEATRQRLAEVLEGAAPSETW